VAGKRKLIGKYPDVIKCQHCNAQFKVDQNKTNIEFDFVPVPYSLFSDHFEGWVDHDSAIHLGWLIRTDNPEALTYLSGYMRHVWRLKLVLGDSMSIPDVSKRKGTTTIRLTVDIPEEAPETKEEAKQQLAEIRLLQKKLRQTKREINADIKEIRADYRAKIARVRPSLFAGSKKTDQRRDVARQKRSLREEQDETIAPYDQLKLSIDNILLTLDKTKLETQTWLEQN